MDVQDVIVVKGYELLERIGSGGFGVVYRAFQSTVGREVAVKAILPGFSNHPEFIRRFESEARMVARLEHLHWDGRGVGGAQVVGDGEGHLGLAPDERGHGRRLWPLV